MTEPLWTAGLSALFRCSCCSLPPPAQAADGARRAAKRSYAHQHRHGPLSDSWYQRPSPKHNGIHALFGAFLFGAVSSRRDNGLAHALESKLESVAVLSLLPLFFAYSGIRTHMGLVSGAQEWLIVAALIGLATLGKFGGSAVAARLSGMRWREASAIGVLMNTRGLMELIVLNVGMDLGVITPTMFTMLVIMALVTTFATTPILHWVYPDSELLRETDGALLTRT